MTEKAEVAYREAAGMRARRVSITSSCSGPGLLWSDM